MRRGVTGTALAVVAAVAVAACGSSANNSSNANKKVASYGTAVAGKLPPVGTPSSGGTISFGQITGQTATDIFPMIDGATCSTATFQFVAAQYVPLYYGPTGAKPQIDPAQSAAPLPKYTNGDKTVTITLKPGLKWSDGKPVDAQDVIFYLDLLKAAVKASGANWCQYAPGQFPDNVSSWTATGPDTVVLQLKKAVNPNWFTINQLQDTNGGVYPMPSKDWNIDKVGGPHLDYTNPANALKIWTFLHKQGADVSALASSPLWKVVDGPFKLKDFNATNSSYDLVPNPSYGLASKPKASEISFQTFTSSTAELNALEQGSLDVGNIDPATQLGAIPKLKQDGYSVFGGPSWGWFGGIINFKDTTDNFDKVIAQPYIRGALAELIDQPAIIKGVYHGWAVPAYGPVPTAPLSQYAPKNATAAPYPYDPAKAAATLKAHGWKVVPGGKTTCAKPGTAANECGAGIPKGNPIQFVWANVPKSTAATGVLESEAFASEAKRAAGVNIELTTKTFNFLTANYNLQNPAAAKYQNDWGVNNFGGINTDYYPTENGIMTPGAGLNMGAFDDPAANKLMDASIASPSSSAIASEVAYLTKNYPVFYMPDQDTISAVSSKVGGSVDGFLSLTQQQVAPQFLYLNKK